MILKITFGLRLLSCLLVLGVCSCSSKSTVRNLKVPKVPKISNLHFKAPKIPKLKAPKISLPKAPKLASLNPFKKSDSNIPLVEPDRSKTLPKPKPIIAQYSAPKKKAKKKSSRRAVSSRSKKPKDVELVSLPVEPVAFPSGESSGANSSILPPLLHENNAEPTPETPTKSKSSLPLPPDPENLDAPPSLLDVE